MLEEAGFMFVSKEALFIQIKKKDEFKAKFELSYVCYNKYVNEFNIWYIANRNVSSFILEPNIQRHKDVKDRGAPN